MTLLEALDKVTDEDEKFLEGLGQRLEGIAKSRSSRPTLQLRRATWPWDAQRE